MFVPPPAVVVVIVAQQLQVPGVHISEPCHVANPVVHGLELVCWFNFALNVMDTRVLVTGGDAPLLPRVYDPFAATGLPAPGGFCPQLVIKIWSATGAANRVVPVVSTTIVEIASTRWFERNSITNSPCRMFLRRRTRCNAMPRTIQTLARRLVKRKKRNLAYFRFNKLLIFCSIDIRATAEVRSGQDPASVAIS